MSGARLCSCRKKKIQEGRRSDQSDKRHSHLGNQCFGGRGEIVVSEVV